MTLSKAEIRGPWVIILTCGHNAGAKGNPARRRRCDICQASMSPAVAYYGRKAIPVSELMDARRAAKDMRQQKKAAKMPPPIREHHRAYRAHLIAEGCSVELADKATMEYRWAGLKGRAGVDRYQRVRDRLDGPRRPSDARYKPTRVDPLLHGPLRVSGQTAAAVKRGTTITDWQYREIR